MDSESILDIANQCGVDGENGIWTFPHLQLENFVDDILKAGAIWLPIGEAPIVPHQTLLFTDGENCYFGCWVISSFKPHLSKWKFSGMGCQDFYPTHFSYVSPPN